MRYTDKTCCEVIFLFSDDKFTFCVNTGNRLCRLEANQCVVTTAYKRRNNLQLWEKIVVYVTSLALRQLG